jgi:hypothetical protein
MQPQAVERLVLAEILTEDAQPQDPDAPLMVLEKIRDDEPEPFVARDPAFPAAATKIIGRLLKKEPSDRYQSARDLLANSAPRAVNDPRSKKLSSMPIVVT